MKSKIAGLAVALATITLGTWLYWNWDESVKPLLAGKEAQAPKKNAKGGRKPVPVKIATARRQDVPIRLEGVGIVKARSKVAVKTRVDGQLFEAAVKEGQLVRKGDLLFRLDPRPFEALARQAEANLARDRANYDKALHDVRRYTELTAKGISPKTRLEETEAQVSALAATVRASEAALELAGLNLSYATIRSPIEGRAGNILVTPGNMVKSDGDEPLLIITELKPIYVAFSLPEQYLDELRRRLATEELKVDVTTMGGKSTPVSGTLFFINNEVDPATGTIQVQARFANEDQRLIPGQFARASVLLAELKDSVTVPARAVQINARGHYLWVVKPDKTVELRAVQIGVDAGQETVISEGLRDGETVVTDGQLRLFPNAHVSTGSDDPKKDGKGKAGKKVKPGPAEAKS
jgi:multidrug efflux system membrane fusion protein